jgi:hypothetical protein
VCVLRPRNARCTETPAHPGLGTARLASLMRATRSAGTREGNRAHPPQERSLACNGKVHNTAGQIRALIRDHGFHILNTWVRFHGGEGNELVGQFGIPLAGSKEW